MTGKLTAPQRRVAERERLKKIEARLAVLDKRRRTTGLTATEWGEHERLLRARRSLDARRKGR